MSSDVILFCEQLKSTIGSQDTKRASIYLDAIDQYFNDRISENELDLAIERVFADNGGILGFLKFCLSQWKVFKSESVKSFELLAKVIELHPTKVKKYATNAILICLNYIRSMQVSARESEKAITVIEKLIENNCCDFVDRSYLMKELLQIQQQSKSGIIQSRIFELIGGFAKDYPDCIENEVGDGVKIRDMYFQTMEKAVVGQQEFSMVSMTGAFNGLKDFLENFGPSDEHKEVFAKRAYDCIKPFAKPLDSSIKAVHKSALKLLACRCELFRKEIFNEFYFWHDLLVDTWLKVDSFDNRRIAIHLLHAIHREIAVYLLESSDSERCRKILSFLQTYFKAILESTKSQAYEIRLAIVGFGLLAAPCKKLLSPGHVDELFNLVIQRTKSVANAVNHNDKDQLEHFPDYVEALSKIMEHVQQLSGIHLHLLQDIVVSVIRNFHLLGAAIHAVTINTLMRTFYNLFELGSSILSDVLEKVIYQGVIWTCSHKLPFDVTSDWINEPDWKEQITYRSYLPLWNGFLSSIESSTYNRTAIVTKIYDQMIITLFKILDKLNLSLRKRVYRDDFGNDRELFFSDPNYDLEPVRSKDFHIFFNLVDFYRALFESQSMDSHKNNFLQWINQLFEKIIEKSLMHPLVSGFIGLMQTFLRISNRINYFGNDLYPDNATIYNSVYYYLKTTMAKAQQSHGEFQLACLKLAFTTPTCMLRTLIKDLTPVFQTALEIGKSNTSLFIAEMALNAIEKYMALANQSSSETKLFLRTILPYFDTYLRGFKNDTIQTVETSKQRSRAAKRTAQKLIKLKENDLQKFQKRILFFLGTLEPEYCLYLVQDTEYTGLVKWNTTHTVRLTLYGNDFHPRIYLDTLMPRICEIATATTDRQKKVTACEIIHATILYLLGSYNHRGRLWTELCPLMLQLACDNDVSLHQMFEPLVMQTMHYISRTDQLHQQGTEIMLKCIMDAICHPSNLPVRDLASRSLREFLSWTFRQSTPQQLAASPFNIDTIIHQLKMFNCDTLHQRRFGAALAFNNIYRVLREEESIIDKYWIDLLHDFCVNLKLSEQQQSEENANNQADVKQVSASLDHILRVLRERKDIFNASNPDRIKPTIFADSLLRDTVLWLFSQCNSMENQYRKKAMDMFLALAPCVDGYSSSAALVRDTQTTESVIEFCENGIEPQIECTDNKRIYTWLRHLYTSLDCYIWFIENNFVIMWQSVFEKSQIFKALAFYINNIMNKNLFQENRDVDSVSLIQKERINVEKSAILIQFLKFLNKTMSIECVPNAIWQSCELIWAIETSVFRPQFLECSTINAEFLSALPKQLETFVGNVKRFAPDGFKNDLSQQLLTNMLDTYQSLSSSIEETMLNYCSISTSDTNKLNGIDLVCGLVKTKSLQANETIVGNIEVLAKEVLYHIFDGIKERQADFVVAKSQSPDILKFTAHMLQVSLQNSNIHINLIDLLLNTTDLILCDSSKAIKQGQHFLSLYKSVIYPYFVKNVDIIVERLISKMMLRNITYVLRILIEIVSEAHKTAAQNINQMKTLTNILLGNWKTILNKSNPNENDAITMVLIELIERIAIICPYELTEISSTAKGLDKWLLNLIKNEKCDLEIKTQAILLLPCIIGPTTYEHLEVQNTLEQLQMLYFPLCTEELRMGSVERASYENIFQAILETMHTSKSPVMLKFVINCSSPDTKHILSYKIIECVRKFMTVIASKHQLKCLNVVFDLFVSRSYDPSIRMVILKRILLEMILSSAKDVVVEFYATHIRAIEQLLETSYGLEMPEFRLEQAFTSRIGAFELLETLIAILTRDEICDKTCPIVIAIFGDKVKKGNELLAWMTQRAVATNKESFQTNNIKYMEWFRQYQCAAFKALCAFISNTQTQLQFYEKFIFSERNWSNMINVTDSQLYMNQTLEVDKMPKIKERLVSIRRLKNTNTETSRSQKYMESQTVFESSLSQDVTKIDLSAAYVRTNEEVEQRDRLANYQPKALKLERNCINDHEIMATVCGVVDHMFENKITPINEDGTLRGKKYAWVEWMCNTIANHSNNEHINIRIFLATMIDNCSSWFRNYADDVAPAILKFLIDWINLNNGIDALAVFLMVDLLEWDSTYRLNTEDEQALATEFMAKFMELINNQERDVFRRNLELIRNLMEKWRDFIRLPYNLLYERVSDTNDESKLNICGLQLNGIVLTNGLIPWNEETKKPFLRAISNCLNNVHSDVYHPAAQVLGMVLHEIIDRENDGQIDQYREYVDDIITRLKQMRTDEKKFMYILSYIDRNFVIDEFRTIILNLIASSHGDVKKYYLQMYLARINENPDLKSDSRDIEILLIDLLNQSNEQKNQLIGLHIFNKSLSILSINQIKSLMPRITAYRDAKQSDLRNLVYEIMKFIRDKHEHDEELNKIATDILLSGLIDVDTIIQSSVFKYWSQILETQTALNHRILYVLRHLYSADFLKYGVQLLIDLNSANLKQRLLQDRGGDDDSKYTEYDINVHMTKYDSNYNVPMFTESTQKHILNDELSPTNVYLRATQNTLQFDPTLDPSMVHQESSSFSWQSSNSLQFQVPPQTLDRRSQFVQSANVAEPKKFDYLRQRILRNSNTVARQRAMAAVQKRTYRQVQNTLQQQRKAGQVALYRRYRFGDYPDFFINSLAFLLPLQMLVKMDMILAKKTFTAIINSVYTELEIGQKNGFLRDLATIVNNISCDSMLFSAMAEIAFTNSVPLNIGPNPGMSTANANDMMINIVLMLENQLIYSVDANEETWSQLAELYYNLFEHDIAASIFANKINSDRSLANAIEYESNRDYLNALRLYMEFVNKLPDSENTMFNKYVNDHCQQFSFNSIFNCFEVMGRWEDLEQSVIGQLTDDDTTTINFEQLWSDEWNIKYLLPHYIRSEIRTLIYTQTEATEKFLTNIQGWLRNSERAQLIKRHFGEQLMILHMANKDYLQAKVFSNQCLETFIEEWSQMSNLSEKMRRDALMNTRRIAEVHKYADVLLNEHIDDIVIAKLCDRWKRTETNKADSTAMWESLISYRIFVTEHALVKFNPKSHPIVDRLIESMFDMQFKLNEIAIQQQNIELSNSVLGRLDSFRRIYGKSTVKSVLQYDLARIRRDRIKCMKQTNATPKTNFDSLIRIWMDLHQFQRNHSTELNANPNIHIKLFEQFNELMTDHSQDLISNCKTTDPSTRQQLIELTASVGYSPNIAAQIALFSTDCCTKMIGLLEQCENSLNELLSLNFSEKEHEIAESYYRLAIFCLKHHSSGLIVDQLEEVSKLLIKSILRGMRHGSKSARLQFPRLLQLPNINNPELSEIFTREASQVPLWTFLDSTTQIMSRFDFKKPCFMDTLLLRLATSYPSIIIYAFQLSFNNFCEHHQSVEIRPLVQQILDTIKNPLIEKFINGMKCLSLPDKVMQHHLYRILNRSNLNVNTEQQLKECFDIVFGNSLRGKSCEKVIPLKNQMIEIMNMDRSNHNQFNDAIKQLLEKLNKLVAAKQKSDDSRRLNIYCPWLAQYHWFGSADFIELPGQYNGNTSPNADNCLKIVKFNENISICQSLRKPIKITAICSDGKSYSFLVKYGEDLRQDDRIQHIQGLMSDQMQLDKSCSQQKIILRTYKVIPLNTTCGLISWIQNTDSIQSFLSANDTKWNSMNNVIRNAYNDFIKRHDKPERSATSSNVTAVLHYTPQEIARNMEKLQSQLPEGSLRKALYKLSASPECFFVLRNNFGKSLAAMSVVHWILTIGDRNLGNFLIDKTNGSLIGIDFNMAFGAATRNLNIPEVVPFRLTSQFVNTLKPLGTDGFFIKIMGHVLRTFNIENESLMAALEVFIHEPTIDYMRAASLNRSSMQSEESLNSSSDMNVWNPEQHLRTIREKLAGMNPIISIENDIKASYYSGNPDIVLAYTNLVKGQPNTYRHQKKERIMTVEEQVKCLIDIATDLSVLGASYIGFQPWV